MLYLYSEPLERSKITATTPFTVTFDGRIGGQQDRLVYIRNDDITRYYTNIRVVAVDTAGLDLTNNSTEGFFWKFMVKDVRPTNEEWAVVQAGNSVSLGADIGSSGNGDIVTFLPLWIRVAIPRGQRIQTITDINIRISATENVV